MRHNWLVMPTEPEWKQRLDDAQLTAKLEREAREAAELAAETFAAIAVQNPELRPF